MLTYAQRHHLPALAAQVTALHPGARLDLVGNEAVLTLAAGIRKAKREQVIALVAATLDDFRLTTPTDPAPAELPPGFLDQHRRGGHHLMHALSNFS